MTIGLPNFAGQSQALNDAQTATTDAMNQHGAQDVQAQSLMSIKMQNATTQATLATTLNTALNKFIKSIGDKVVQLAP